MYEIYQKFQEKYIDLKIPYSILDFIYYDLIIIIIIIIIIITQVVTQTLFLWYNDGFL